MQFMMAKRGRLCFTCSRRRATSCGPDGHPLIATKEETMLLLSRGLIAGVVACVLSSAIASMALAASPPGLKRTDVQIVSTDAKDMKVKNPVAATPSPLTLKSLSATHAVDVYPYTDVPDSADTYTLRVQSK
jgi:hypothetical protein